jgi:hypothetical protein
MEESKWNAFFSVRTDTGERYQSHDGKKMLIVKAKTLRC